MFLQYVTIMASLRWRYFAIFLLVGAPTTPASRPMESNDAFGMMVQDLQVYLHSFLYMYKVQRLSLKF